MPFSFENGFLSGQYTKKYSCRQIVTYRQVSGGIFYAIFSYFSDSLFSTYKIQSFESICDYLDYLCLKKCVMLQEMIPAIKSDEDKQAFQAISNIAKEQCDCIGNGLIIQSRL